MKKAYTAPQLSTFGNVEDVTNSFGTPGAADIFQNAAGQTFPGSLIGQTGSQNGVVIQAPNP